MTAHPSAVNRLTEALVTADRGQPDVDVRELLDAARDLIGLLKEQPPAAVACASHAPGEIGYVQFKVKVAHGAPLYVDPVSICPPADSGLSAALRLIGKSTTDERSRQIARDALTEHALQAPAISRNHTPQSPSFADHRLGLISQLYDSAQMTVLPRWARQLMERAGDELCAPTSRPSSAPDTESTDPDPALAMSTSTPSDIDEVERLRHLLRDTVAVAITMLFDSHRDDTIAEFSVDELAKIAAVGDALRPQQVEHIYRRAWDAANSSRPIEAAAFAEVLCRTCGKPTMHLGSTCYACG